MTKEIPRILADSMANGSWKNVSPNVLRRCLGEELDDLQLFESIFEMQHVFDQLDYSGIFDLPGFCMTREDSIELNDPRLEYSRALFIGGSVIPGDDVFVAIRLEDYKEYDPPVLVLDDRKHPPNRWRQRGRLSDLIKGISSECNQ